jgi:hypothetical protein
MRGRTFLLASILLMLLTIPAPAWWIKGHGVIAEAAAMRLPDAMPAFFRAAGKQLNYLAGDPDRMKNQEAKHLRAAESPDHFVDLEDFEEKDLPADRYQAAAMLARMRHRPERTGMLPYALMEHFDRLTVAFRDYREFLDKEKKLEESGAAPASLAALAAEKQAIEMKCIVYAGVLSHFTGDAAMPLHTTRDYDGRKGPEGKLVQRGIHAKIDGFPELNSFTVEEISRGVEAKAIDDVWQLVLKTIKESYQHIDRCYALDKEGGFDKATPESREFIMQRCRGAAQFTADMWYTAWQRSAKLPPSP